MIDLRSDTVTRPSQAMRAAMAAAPVGDDVFGEDPTVNELQRSMCALFGKEDALFVSSGVMGNQLAIKAHTQPGDEIIVEAESHVFHYETGGPSVISGVQLHCVASDRGILQAEDVERAVRGPEYYFPRTSLVVLENTHNRAGGTIYSLERIAAIRDVCARRGMRLHIDGARLWNAHVATGIPLRAFADLADSVTVCFSKGLGAPVGSMLMGDKAVIATAHKYRKMLGGGMRQVGILAAGAAYAVEHNIARLRDDHVNAQTFARAVADVAPAAIDPAYVQTNIVVIDCEAIARRPVHDLLAALAAQGVLLSAGRPGAVRAVFNLDVSAADTEKAITAFRSVV